MGDTQLDMLIPYTNLAINIGVVVVGVKIIRHLTRMELRVSLMWAEFKKRFHIVTTQEDSDHGF